MKKTFTIAITSIIALLITFILADTFSLYHFGDIPTVTTVTYLVSLFSLIEYILLFIIYVIVKKKKKEKIGLRKLISAGLFFTSLILILVYITMLDIDWLNQYMYSCPFYVNVVIRSIEFLIPAIILIIIGIVILRKKK